MDKEIHWYLGIPDPWVVEQFWANYSPVFATDIIITVHYYYYDNNNNN
jgi:aspartate/tyrosine/aromatic aminotransferase